MEKKYSSIVLTGGGTAGHIMPNLALVPELKKHFNKIYYLGTKNGLESQIIKKRDDIEFIEIPAVKFRRKLSFNLFLIPFKLIKCIKKTKSILKTIMPSVIFSKGGYVSIPVVIAGHSLGIKIVSHESDMSLGLANKIIYPYSTFMCTSFRKTATRKKTIYTGSPIRPEIYTGKKEALRAKLKLDKKDTLLIFGGSLGATALNNLVFDNINILCEKYNILHIVGKGNKKNIQAKNYRQFEFVDNIQDFYALCDACVCRSGANTIFEILALNKPALLIPLPKAESRGDQIENAEFFEKKGYSLLLKQEFATNQVFINKVYQVFKDSKSLKSAMSSSQIKNSNSKIISLILRAIKKV